MQISSGRQSAHSLPWQSAHYDGGECSGAMGRGRIPALSARNVLVRMRGFGHHVISHRGRLFSGTWMFDVSVKGPPHFASLVTYKTW